MVNSSTYQKPLQPFIRLFPAVAILLFFLGTPAVSAQQSESREHLERIIERAVSELDPEESEMQISDLVEYLENLAQHPVNINRAGIERISQIPGLDFQSARAIIHYRENVAPFTEIGQITEVEGIGRVTFENISPFITIGSRTERGRDLLLSGRYWTSNSRAESLTRVQSVLEAREGYARPDSLGGYLGSPVKFNNRLRYTSNHLSMNLTQDKDPGEPVEGITGFDYTSWHVAATNVGRLQNLILGDFRVSYGQGLTLWNGGAFGKSSQIPGTAVRNDPGIRPYTSAQETNAFRGAAFTYGSALQVSGFYSNRRRTASELDHTYVRAPSQTGLHRTVAERERRHNLGQETFGGRARAEFGRGIVGVSGYYNRFSRPVQPGNQPYQAHHFSGTENSAISFDGRVSAGSSLLFGEAARSQNGGLGLVAGSETRLRPGTDVALAYRNYSPDFQSIFGSGFGEQSGTQNEEGLYLGLRQAFGETLQLSSYIDHFRTKAARFRNTRPTSGFDWLARIDYSPLPELSLYVQVREKRQEQETQISDEFGRSLLSMSDNIRSGYRIQAEYQILPTVRLRTRFDFVRARETLNSPSTGYLIFQDIRVTPRHNLTIDGRITHFDTDDFNSRVFQFENDLLYVMSNTMLFDQGQRMYIVIRYQPVDPVTIRFKAATTLYENRQTIGSGLDEIRGNRRSDLGVQAQVRF